MKRIMFFVLLIGGAMVGIPHGTPVIPEALSYLGLIVWGIGTLCIYLDAGLAESGKEKIQWTDIALKYGPLIGLITFFGYVAGAAIGSLL
jgi:hypothetical protein